MLVIYRYKLENLPRSLPWTFGMLHRLDSKLVLECSLAALGYRLGDLAWPRYALLPARYAGSFVLP